MVQLLILTLSQTEQRTTWGIPTHPKVPERHQINKRKTCCISEPFAKSYFVLVLTGAYYNIIVVPPTKETADDTLEGSKVLCSIPSGDKSKPSYYHSFGEQAFAVDMTCSVQNFLIMTHLM